ncbi:hypothetical protein [Acidiphilium cryptum]|uniref:Uncharacterized protein n=1 Tax=Acidiphilium cryptum (strain JF-5) TaxID=349163 RepID=A5FTK9_ACICJ|nr:hypothetical protein [Acidiphilium cryptum]ABQ28941.1 hypothetical protein Acry_3329 [Acidiphilium cryptum JF-5]
MSRSTSPTAAPALRGVGPNLILNGNGFYVSYNDFDRGIYGGDTTALVLGQMERFFILNGDHRGQYAPPDRARLRCLSRLFPGQHGAHELPQRPAALPRHGWGGDADPVKG